MVKIVFLNIAFLEFCHLQTSPVEGQSLQQKVKKKIKRKGKKDISMPLSQNFDFCAFQSKNVVKKMQCWWKERYSHVANASLAALELILPISRLKIHVQKMPFRQRTLGSLG